MSVCLSAPLEKKKSGGCGNLWSKNVFLYWPAKTQIQKGVGVLFCKRLIKCAVLDQPTVDNGVFSTEKYVAVAVGCWHLNGTSSAL